MWPPSCLTSVVCRSELKSGKLVLTQEREDTGEKYRGATGLRSWTTPMLQVTLLLVLYLHLLLLMKLVLYLLVLNLLDLHLLVLYLYLYLLHLLYLLYLLLLTKCSPRSWWSPAGAPSLGGRPAPARPTPCWGMCGWTSSGWPSPTIGTTATIQSLLYAIQHHHTITPPHNHTTTPPQPEMQEP